MTIGEHERRFVRFCCWVIVVGLILLAVVHWVEFPLRRWWGET